MIVKQMMAHDDHRLENIKSLSALALRLGEPRRKGVNDLATVRWLHRKQPGNLPKLIERCQRILLPRNRRIALDRVFKIMGGLKNEKLNFNIKLPYVSGTSVADIFNLNYREQCQSQLQKGKALMFTGVKSANTSAKRLMVNVQKWTKIVDTSKFKCTCDRPCSMLGVTRSNMANHVVALHSDTIWEMFTLQLQFGDDTKTYS